MDSDTSKDAPAWEFLRLNAIDEMTLPVAEDALRQFLGDRFDTASSWRNVLTRLIECDGDGDACLALLADIHTEMESNIPAHCPPAPQLKSLEAELAAQMTELQQRKRISQMGRLSIDELLDPADDKKLSRHYELPAEVSDIIAQVVHEEAVVRGDVMDVDEDDDESDAEEGPELSSTAIIDICRALEKVCLAEGHPHSKSRRRQQLMRGS
ncbi:hypothetical protein B0H14DRAFT_3517964 [Mycena olivaceomarginata]|nr:hypothetical protein B0H14DRAFT_3517964 [Mycena olivaceomarginata]